MTSGRPRLRLRRATAAEDDEVVCVVDHMRLELAPLLGQPPVLEKAVHVDVGEPARPPTQRIARCFPTTPMASGATPRNWFREQDLSAPTQAPEDRRIAASQPGRLVNQRPRRH